MSATLSLSEHGFALVLQRQVYSLVWYISQFQQFSTICYSWICSLTLWYPRYMLQYRSKSFYICHILISLVLKYSGSCPIFWCCNSCGSVSMSNSYKFRSDMKFRCFFRFTGLCDWSHERYRQTRSMVLDLRECLSTYRILLKFGI